MKKSLIAISLSFVFVSSVFGQLVPITLHYYGTFTLKIVSSEGRGQVLSGLSESIDNSTPRVCTLKARQNSDLVIDLVVIDDSKPYVWPRARISKHVGVKDSIINIMDYDIDMLALYEMTMAKITVTDPSFRVSIRDVKITKSKTMPMPIGESYLKLSYTDSRGMSYSDVLLPVSVPEKGGNITITPENLIQALKVKL